MATLREIASKAGVSPSTVSRVLAGRAAENRIPEPTAQRIQRLASEAGYQPNVYARYLKTRRCHTIGILVTEIGNPFFATILSAVEQVARARGYATVIAASGEDPARTAEYLDMLSGRPTDGLLVVPTEGAGVTRRLRSLRRRGVPLVLVDRKLGEGGAAFDSVVTDSRGGTAELVRALKGFGCRRPAYVGGPMEIWTGRERQEGFRLGVASCGLDVADCRVEHGAYTREHGRQAARGLMGEAVAPDGFVAANNSLLLGVLDALAELGRGAEGLPVAGFDGVPFAALLGRPVAIAEQPNERIGRLAAERLIDRIEGRAAEGDAFLRLSVTIRSYGLPTAQGGVR